MLCENNISIVDVYEKIFSRRNLRKQKYTRFLYILNDCYNFHQIQLLAGIFFWLLVGIKIIYRRNTNRYRSFQHRVSSNILHAMYVYKCELSDLF